MKTSTLEFTAALAAGLVAGFAFAKGRKKNQLAIATVADIEGQIAALDPATRANVIARLSKDSIDLARATAGAKREA